jgi:SAM-dependent methyltransferase
MPPTIDALTSPTLRHLRTLWWNEEFTEFLTETLRPRAGKRILDVGCGQGIAEFHIGRLHVSQLRLVGVDRDTAKAAAARQRTASHNIRAAFAAGDARRLPFRDEAFDSTYCVAVLQHIDEVADAVQELARVTVPGGRVLVVEPDNASRYFYSSVSSGMRACETARRLFSTLVPRADVAVASVGPRLPGILARHGIEPIELRLFPVTQAQLGVPDEDLWNSRRAWVERVMHEAREDTVRTLAEEYLQALETYQAEATTAGSWFVEIQNTMLFATLGQRSA